MKVLLVVIVLCLSQAVLANSKKLVVLGDSLSEGYGVAKSSAFPAILEKRILESGKNWQVINAGVSGSTSASGLSRLKWLLQKKPDLVLLALGANDGLRGISTVDTEKNLREVIQLSKKNKIKIILAGMMVPPNYGEKYSLDFKSIYTRISKTENIPLIPFILEGVAGIEKYNQPDGIHPTEEGHKKIAEVVFKSIQSHL